METLYEQSLGNPTVLALLLFLGPFVLEEAAIVSGSALSAAEEIQPFAALVALYLGTVVSDWLLYGIGAAAGRSARLRAWIGPGYIESGRKILDRGATGAAIMARLIPWLLFPVFVASGFVNVGFIRFAAVNAAVAFGYVNLLFWGIYGLDLVLFQTFERWGWALVALTTVLVIAVIRSAGRRVRGSDPQSLNLRDSDHH